MNLKASITPVLILALILCSPAGIYPQTAFPRLEPDQKALEYHRLGVNKNHSWDELAAISLWASTGEPSPSDPKSGGGSADNGGANSSNLEKIKAAVSILNNSAEIPSSQREKAEYILTFMHSNFLKRYSLYQTRVDTLLSFGTYNCVSSAALYIIFCNSAGLRTSAVITKEHAFVIVHIDGLDIDVETTNRYGFDPGNRKEFHDQFGKLTGFSYVPAQNYRDRQTIENIELISLILNNKISDYERRSNFADPVPLAVDRAALLLGSSFEVTEQAYASEFLFTDPRRDLMDRLLNYGASLLKSNKEEEGIRWAVSASARYSDPVRWNNFLHAAVNNRIARFIRDRKIKEAEDFLENNKSHISKADYDQLDSVIADADLLIRANNIITAADGDAVVSGIEQARNGGRISEKRASELLTFAIQKTASLLCASPGRNWRAAIAYLEKALYQYGVNRDLEQTMRTYKNNLAAEYHNRFAAEWNKKNYGAAEQILNEGLEQFPDNRQLLSDRQIVNRYYQQ